MRPLLLLALLLLLPLASLAETVESVYDGDTLTLTTGEKVRLACVDTPELRNTAKKKADKPAALAARDYVVSLVDGVELRVERLKTDLYGRTVARVYLPDGRELAEELVSSGHAVVDPRYAKPCPWVKGG